MTDGRCDTCGADINVDGNGDYLWEHPQGLLLCDSCHDTTHNDAGDSDDCCCEKWT